MSPRPLGQCQHLNSAKTCLSKCWACGHWGLRTQPAPSCHVEEVSLLALDITFIKKKKKSHFYYVQFFFPYRIKAFIQKQDGIFHKKPSKSCMVCIMNAHYEAGFGHLRVLSQVPRVSPSGPFTQMPGSGGGLMLTPLPALWAPAEVGVGTGSCHHYLCSGRQRPGMRMAAWHRPCQHRK